MGEAWSPQETLLCVLPWARPTELLDSFARRHPDLRIIYDTGNSVRKPHNPKEQDEIDKKYPWTEVTILYTFSTLPSSAKVAPNLKLIHFASAGVDFQSRSPVYRHTDIPLSTSSGVHGPQISEWVLMQILSHSHYQKTLLKWQREHRWTKYSEHDKVRDSVGLRLGVLGYGSIGRQTARVCHAMGMEVLAFTASLRTTPESKRDNGYIVPGTGDLDGTIPKAWYSGLDKESLHEFLKQDLDVLLVSVPSTAETHHLLAREEFEILSKNHAFVVNISRGVILNQDDLTAALKKKDGLGGAALDVTDPEPLNSDSELWDLHNVAITPHISGSGTKYAERSLAILEINLENLATGRPLLNRVNRKRGY